jgi:hypothetical protein
MTCPTQSFGSLSPPSRNAAPVRTAVALRRDRPSTGKRSLQTLAGYRFSPPMSPIALRDDACARGRKGKRREGGFLEHEQSSLETPRLPNPLRPCAPCALAVFLVLLAG